MNRLSRTAILQQITDKWALSVGRHLYLVMGTYKELAAFERDLAYAKTPERKPISAPVNVNKTILNRLPDKDVQDIANMEGKYPTSVQKKLVSIFEAFLRDSLADRNILILKHLELLFAFNLDLSALRINAANQKHIILLIPGKWIDDSIILFHETDERFHKTLPGNLLMEQHIWEISHAK